MKTILFVLVLVLAPFASLAQEEVYPPPPLPPKKSVPIAEQIIDFPDVEAQFPGGEEAMRAFIETNLMYPEAAIAMKDQGKVYLSFVVEPDGSLTNVKVERSISKELDNEAKRLLQSMPAWRPAEAGGKKIRSRCRMPIVFSLPD